ncbi:hypothetical protein BD413DRAFT_489768 [Trametes elegans]|nr:hypothetical protein BD413DRAFT_489768 [Trametes elegans]
MIAPEENVSGEVDIPTQLKDLSITACAGKINDATVLAILAVQTLGADTASESMRQLERYLRKADKRPSHGSTESQKVSPSAAPIISTAGKDSKENKFEHKEIASEKLYVANLCMRLGTRTESGYEESSEDEDFIAKSPQMVQPTSMRRKPVTVPNKLTAQRIAIPKAAELSSSPATSASTRSAEDHGTHGAVSHQSELSKGNTPNNNIKDEPATNMRIPYCTMPVASPSPSTKSLKVQNGARSVVTPNPRPSTIRAQNIQFSALGKQGETEGSVAATPTGWSGHAGGKKSVQVNKED